MDNPQVAPGREFNKQWLDDMSSCLQTQLGKLQELKNLKLGKYRMQLRWVYTTAAHSSWRLRCKASELRAIDRLMDLLRDDCSNRRRRMCRLSCKMAAAAPPTPEPRISRRCCSHLSRSPKTSAAQRRLCCMFLRPAASIPLRLGLRPARPRQPQPVNPAEEPF